MWSKHLSSTIVTLFAKMHKIRGIVQLNSTVPTKCCRIPNIQTHFKLSYVERRGMRKAETQRIKVERISVYSNQRVFLDSHSVSVYSKSSNYIVKFNRYSPPPPNLKIPFKQGGGAVCDEHFR